MTDSALTVKISADVTSLQAKAAVAKAELADVNATVKSLASQFVEASDEMKGSLAPQLDAAAQKAAIVKTELVALNAEMKQTGNSGEVATGFRTFAKGISAIGESAEGIRSKLAVFTDAYAAISELALAGLGLEQAFESVKSVAELGESIGQLSEKTGLSTREVSGLRVVAINTNTDMDQLSSGLRNLAKNMETALANPASEAAKQFHELGISLHDSQGQLLPIGDVLQEVASKFGSFSDGAAKSADAGDLFGTKIGSSLIPFLNQLSTDGLQGASQRAQQLGVSFSQAAVASDEQFVEAMHTASLSVEGLRDNLINDLIPGLDAVMEGMGKNEAVTVLEETAMGALDATLKGVIGTVELVVSIFDDIIDVAYMTGQEFGDLINMSRALGLAMEGDFREAEQVVSQSASSMAADYENAVHGMEQNTENFLHVLSALRTGVATPLPTIPSPVVPTVAAPNLAPPGSDSKALEAARKAQEEQTQIENDAANAQKEIADSAYNQQVSQWDAEVARHKMTKAQEIQDEISAQDQIYQAALNEANQEAELAPVGTAAKAKALDDIEVLTAEHNAEMAKLNTDLVTQQIEDAKTLQEQQEKAADATSAAWQKAFAPITQAFDSSLNGVLQGTQTLQQAEAKAAQSIALAFIDAEAKKVEAFAVGELQILASAVRSELGMTAAATAGNTTRAALKASADATGSAVDAASNSASIANSAHTAFAGAYAAVAGVPFVGPVLAPAAGAAAYAAVMAMDVLSASGGLAIGSGENPLVQLHENETVLPAYIAQPLTSMLADGGNMATDNSVGDSTVNNHFNLTANGGSNGVQVNDLLSMLNTAVRSGSLQGYPALARAMRRGN